MPRVRSHWKMPVPLPRLRRRKALGEIERNHDADEAAAHALQQAPEKQRTIAVRESNDGNADNKRKSAQDHERLAADEVGDHTGKERGKHAAQQHGRYDHGKLRLGEARRCLEIWIRAADDAYVDAVEKAAQSRNQQQKHVVAALAGGGRQLCPDSWNGWGLFVMGFSL
jgi:hypothetical protein